MVSFNKSKSYKKLISLAKNPIDLTNTKIFTTTRIRKMIARALDFKLFFSTERVSFEIMEVLVELASEMQVIDKMRDMQSGKIINKIEGYQSEKRAVMHTAMRDFFNDRNPSKSAIKISDMAYQEIEKLKTFLQKIDLKDQFTDIIQIGIGGSDLGPRALYLALKNFAIKDRKAHFISNVDPDDAASILKGLTLSKCLVVVVSKSGTTLETLTNEEFVRQHFEKNGLNPKNHFISVTGEKSPMDNPDKYLESFYIWDFIGGRYSATSMVGAVTLSFTLGIGQFKELLNGASEMDKLALSKKVYENLPLLSALLGVWNRNFLNLPTVAIIPYSQALSRFSAHLQQLDMESNGKRVDKIGNFINFNSGPIIWGEPGTNGQHSFYQLIHQGTSIVPIEFIGFKQNQLKEDVIIENTTSQEKLLSNLFAQSIALATGKKSKNPNQDFPGNRPNRILFKDKLDAKTMGQLLSFYENKVAFQGFIWNINSFDQEGVQLGKVLAKKIISLFKHKRDTSDASKFLIAEEFLKQIDDF
jgi:glucose-6-phosphate isomerase